MSLTTPAPPIDLPFLFPGLAGRRRRAVRLHPRSGTPTVFDSSMGTPPLWPLDEPWPTCAMHDLAPFVPVTQLWRRDIPEVAYPDGTDVVQLLWCAYLHPPGFEPDIRVWWRNSSTVRRRLTTFPQITNAADRDLVPSPCAVLPERVWDLPSLADVPETLLRDIETWEQANDVLYATLSTAPGSKIGGWPAAIDRPPPPRCPAGHSMELLLTVASCEHDADSAPAWQPLEETGRDTGVSDLDLMLGDAGDVLVYVCAWCADRPIANTVTG